MNTSKVSMLLFSIMLCCLSCKKNTRTTFTDPFFDAFPKKFIFDRIEPVGSAEMYSDKEKISDEVKIQKFVSGYRYFNIDSIKKDYRNDSYNFRNNKLITYNGRYSFRYDTLNFNKENEVLSLKTEPIITVQNSMCRSIDCDLNAWKVDSIDCTHWPVGTEPICAGVIIIENKTYKIIGNELHVPLLAYRYSSPNYGIAISNFNEFNNHVITRLRKVDTIAICRFELIFKQQ